MPGAAYAQELLLFGGGTRDSGPPANTYAWGVEYAQGIGAHSYATLGWLNEGHLGDHHRDGPVAEIWRRFEFRDRRLSLEFGLGPYSYFDTAQAEQGESYANDHGWGVIYSAGITWYAANRWLFHMRANRIETETRADTTMVALGVGYQLDAPPVRGARASAPARRENTTNNEIAVLLGRTILNSYESENATAVAFEYRHGLGPYLDGTLGWLREGGNHIIRRNGVTAQLWLVRPFFNDRFTLGAGAGGYLAVNQEGRVNGEDVDDERLSAIVTLTTSYRFGSRWFARLAWNRIATHYNRDTDSILLGGGYRF
jgi:hypothetical protein